MTSRRPTLIFDADDTIWPCGEYYMASRETLAVYIERNTGLPPALTLKLIGAIESSRKVMPDAFLSYALGRSYKAAFLTAQVLTGQPLDECLAESCAELSTDVVWKAPYPIFPGVLEMFDAYRDGGWQVLIATKGDDVEQTKKLLKNKVLRRVDGVYVTPHKTPEFYQEVCRERLADGAATAMIGDSMESDILPAQAAGIATTVWVENTAVWGHAEGKATFQIGDVLDVPKHLPYAAP